MILPIQFRTDMAFTAISPNFVVDDVNATLDFYVTHLGFQKIATVPETGTLNWAMFANGAVTLMLQSLASVKEELPTYERGGPSCGILLYIDVDDVQALRKQIEGHATIVVDLHTTFYGATEFTIEDPNGFMLTFAHHPK